MENKRTYRSTSEPLFARLAEEAKNGGSDITFEDVNIVDISSSDEKYNTLGYLLEKLNVSSGNNYIGYIHLTYASGSEAIAKRFLISLTWVGGGYKILIFDLSAGNFEQLLVYRGYTSLSTTLDGIINSDYEVFIKYQRKLPDLPDDWEKTYVLKAVNGTLTWVEETAQ